MLAVYSSAIEFNLFLHAFQSPQKQFNSHVFLFYVGNLLIPLTIGLLTVTPPSVSGLAAEFFWL